MMKIVFVWIFVAIWFLHLAISSAGFCVALKLWNDRRANKLTTNLTLFLTACGSEWVETILLLLFAKNVVFTWKFSTILFTFLLLKDIVRCPLLWYLLKGDYKDGHR